MNWARVSFLIFLISALFIIKCSVVYFMLSPVVLPDEITYGNHYAEKNPHIWGTISDLSLYSQIPWNFGQTGALLANSFLTSLCSLPIFYLFRRHNTERNAALLTAIVACSGILWVYALVNMTEALLFFMVLNAGLLIESYPILGTIPAAFVKTTGIAVFLSTFRYGFYLALAGGVVYMFLFGSAWVSNPGQNLVMCLLRNGWYILFASLGTAFFTGYRVLRGKGDKVDNFAMSYLAVQFAMVFGFMFVLPHVAFFGRYFDAAILLLMTTFRLPIHKDKWFLPSFAIILVLALAYPLVTNFQAGVLDAGTMTFLTAVKQMLYLSNPAFPQP